MARRPFDEEPADTREAIMQATYRALREHGYADLTIQRIGDRFEKSKSLLYHHYESKDDLLLDFLQFMLDEFEGTVPEAADAGPAERLEALFDLLLADDMPEEHREFQRAMTELRAQATHHERYRESFTRHQAFFEDRLRAIVAAGVERGDFRDVDPERVASFLFTVIDGGMYRRATTKSDSFADVRAELAEYVESRLLATDAGEADAATSDGGADED